MSLNTKLFYSVERSDGKRYNLPAAGNSSIKFEADATPTLGLDVSSVTLKDIELTEAFAITALTTGDTGTFTIAGDQTTRFVAGVKFNVIGSTNNGDKVFTVKGAALNSGNTVITIEGGATHPDVGAFADPLNPDGSIHVMDLVLRPPSGTVARITSALLVSVSEDSAGDDGNVKLVAFTQAASGLGSDVTAASGAVNLANTFTPVDIAGTEVAVTNTAPLYLLRTAADTGTSAKVSLALDGQAI